MRSPLAPTLYFNGVVDAIDDGDDREGVLATVSLMKDKYLILTIMNGL